MTKYDAFGREIGEDPLAGLRDDAPAVETQPQTRSEADAQAHAVQATHDRDPEPRPFAATARTIDLYRHHGGGGTRVVAWGVGLTILLAVGGVGLAVFSEVDNAVDSTRDAIKSAVPQNNGSPEPGGGEDRGPALGLQRGSLLTRAALAPALARMRDGGHGRLRLLRAAPDRLNAQTVTSAGALRSVSVGPDGRPQKVSESAGVGRGMPTISYASIDPAAPFRLTRSAAGRLRLPTTRVDYLVLMAAPGVAPRWLVYFKDGRGAFEGDTRGRVVRRIS